MDPSTWTAIEWIAAMALGIGIFLALWKNRDKITSIGRGKPPKDRKDRY